MSTPEVTSEALFRAAVGGKRAAYYVPRFLKFEQGDTPRHSWNFAAFFGLFWFFYRRMYGTAFTVGIVGPIVLLYVPSLVLAAFGVPPKSWIASLPNILYDFVLIPAYANFLYFSSVERRIESLRKKSSDDNEVLEALNKAAPASRLAPAVLLVVLVCITLARPYLAAYLAARSQVDSLSGPLVNQASILAGRLRTAIVKHYVSTHKWPETLQVLADEGQLDRGFSYSGVRVDLGTITIQFGSNASPMLSGHNLSFRPSLSKTGAILWTCGYASSKGSDVLGSPAGPDLTNVPPQYLPSECR